MASWITSSLLHINFTIVKMSGVIEGSNYFSSTLERRLGFQGLGGSIAQTAYSFGNTMFLISESPSSDVTVFWYHLTEGVCG